MVLRFEEPEEKEEKPAGEKKVLKEHAPPKPASSGSSGSGSGSKKNSHRRVFTNSTYYFAEIEVTIHEAQNLATKKSCCPFCRIYLGSTIFNTATKKKTISPVFNETFKAKVDRDDFFQLRIYDQAKLERQLEMNEVEAIGKKKVAIKDLVKGGDSIEETYKFPQGGEIRISYKITVNPPKVGMIHTKVFSYPSWMNDKYMINIVQPDFENQKTGVNTLTRYAMRWLRNQRVIGNLSNEDDDGSDGEKEEKEELPEGIQFKLLDMSFSCHDKVLQLLVTYQWVPKVVVEEENSVDFSLSQILQIKSFHIDSKLQKKQLNKIKPLSPDAYQKEFKKVTTGLDGLLTEVHSWIDEHREEISTVFKLIPISTYNSYHAILWYYR